MKEKQTTNFVKYALFVSVLSCHSGYAHYVCLKSTYKHTGMRLRTLCRPTPTKVERKSILNYHAWHPMNRYQNSLLWIFFRRAHLH